MKANIFSCLPYISVEIVKKYLHSSGFQCQCYAAQIFCSSAELRREIALIFSMDYFIEIIMKFMAVSVLGGPVGHMFFVVCACSVC